MIYFVALSLGLLLAGNHAVAKNFLYTPTLFTGVWLLSVVGLILSGDTFYAVSAETLLVYLVGALMFSIGGLTVYSCMSANSIMTKVAFPATRTARIRLLLDLVLIVVMIGLPFFAKEISAGNDLSDPLYFASQRLAKVESADSSERTFSPIKNLEILAFFLALALHYENDGTFSRKWRGYLAILLALVYGGLTGTKGNSVNLLLTLLFVAFSRANKVNFVVLGYVMAVIFTLFGISLIYVNFAYEQLDSGMKTFETLFMSIQNYWLGGLVTFERVVVSPNSLESVQHLNRFFLETANGLGANFYIPPIHAAYTNISPSQDSNTYTLYFTYFKDYGWLGLILGMSVLGGALTWIYVLASRGEPLAIFYSGLNACGIILSIHAEHFLLNLNFYTKALIFFYSIYYLFPRLAFFDSSHWSERRA